ncbi:MAG: hypothetical protein HYU99_10545 [Deltaproteobacteria bacterium]|nr:hypothetical protein [Deltaproteobacteria bacterium]
MKQIVRPFIKINLLILFVFCSMPARAQELPPPLAPALPADQQGQGNVTDTPPADEPQNGQKEVTPDDFLGDPTLPFTGTLDAEDEDNEKAQEERELFGGEEEQPAEGEEPAEGTHLLKLKFTSHVQFMNPGEPSPYLELEYTNSIEAPVTLKPSRFETDVTMSFDVQKWGYLAQNELFSCDLDVSMKEVSVHIATRLYKAASKEGEGEEGEEEEKTAEERAEELKEKPYSAAVKIAVGDDIREDWFSYCTDLSGATLNTQGDTEAYDLAALKAVEPSLSAIVIEEFAGDEAVEVELVANPIQVEDNEIRNDIFLSGEGTLAIEPME